jgi:RNA polymerase sigma factor (sigma-70 family)
MQRVFQTACRAASTLVVEETADGKLLEQFLGQRDGAAFAELVRRHGPMVLGVCRRIIRSHHEAEDAFQATFLVLVRKAASLAGCEQVGSWLHGVAYRTALEARGRLAQRQSREGPLSEFPVRIDDECMQNEIKSILDQEVNRLPDKYRLPVILCELEGRSRGEAARLLCLPEGTLSSRLATARKALARRLSKYGYATPPVSVGIFASEQTATAAVPERLVDSTVASALHSVAGQALAAIPASVVSLADSVIRTMSFAKTKLIAAFAVVVGVIVTGVVVGTTPEASKAIAAVEVQKSIPEKPDIKVEQPADKVGIEAPPEVNQREESAELKAKLKQMESEINRIRQAMLSECAAEEKKIDEMIRKARNDLEDAIRKRDFDRQRKAVQTMNKATNDKLQVFKVRSEVEMRIRMDDSDFEQRVGLTMSIGPVNAFGKFLNGAKDRTGIMIERVARDSAAANAGLQPLDILLEIDGKPVPSSLLEFRKMLAEFEPETPVDVTLMRKGRKQTVKGLLMAGAKE